MVESKQQAWTKQSLPQRYLCVGCQFKSDQAIKSICLKGHVRARGSTLWRHRWQEASEFLCTKTPLFGENWTTKNIAKKTQKRFLQRATNVMLSKFLGWCRGIKKKPKKNRGFIETALRAVLINSIINSWIRINLGPKILRSCFLHWFHSPKLRPEASSSTRLSGWASAWPERDNVVYWKTKRKINDDLQCN